MIKFLDQIRTPKKEILTSRKIINTLIIFILGAVLGIFSKWLDNLSINDDILWQRLLGILDLGNIFSMFGIWLLLALSISIYSNSSIRAAINVFLFFLGMNISYHLYTIYFSGFNPMNYMMIWYGITLFSPILAFISWYAKGKGKLSLFINIAIIAVMTFCCFNIGLWYFSFTNILNTIFFISTVIVLYDNPKKSIFSLIGGLIVAYIIRIGI